MDPFLRDRLSLIAAFGCGLALSATFTGLYSKMKSQHSKTSLRSKIDSLTEVIEQLKKDVEEIKVASLRGSPYSIRPIEKWDIDRLERISETGSGTNVPDGHDHSEQFKNSNESINPETSDENEEFFDLTEGDNNLHPSFSVEQTISPGIVPYENDRNTKNDNDYQEWLDETDRLLQDSKTDKQLLYNRISMGIDEYGEVADLLWRKAKASHLLSVVAEKKGDKNKKKQLIYETLSLSEKAVDLDEKCADCHKWYAIALGSITDYVGTKERIECGYKFKEHVSKALQLNPTDETSHYLLGRWSSEVSNLTWIEKKLAATLYATVPETTANEALQSLLKAYELRPNWKQNIYYICKTLLTMKNRDEAQIWIKRGLDCPIEDDDDQLTHEKLVSLKTRHFKS